MDFSLQGFKGLKPWNLDVFMFSVHRYLLRASNVLGEVAVPGDGAGEEAGNNLHVN